MSAMSVRLNNAHHDSSHQDKVEVSYCIEGTKEYKGNAVAEIRRKLTRMKNHLCKNKDEVDNFHPSWFCIPSDDFIERVYHRSTNSEQAYEKLLLDMYTPLLLEFRIDNDPRTLLACNNDLRMLVYNRQALKLDMAFHEKYNVSCCDNRGLNDISRIYHSSRLEGQGLLDTLSEMHLNYFGEFEGAGVDEWELDDDSMIEVGKKAKGYAA